MPQNNIAELVLRSAVDYAVVAMDSARMVTYWNTGAERVLGWTSEEMLGQSADVFFTPEDRDNGVPLAEQARATRDGRAIDERWHMRKDGSRFWGSGELMPLEGGQAMGFLKIVRDRTAQRQAEELQLLLNGELVHRVKNLLAMVQAMVSQSLRGEVDVAEVRNAIVNRIAVLSRAQDVLLVGMGEGANLSVVLGRTLDAHDFGGAVIRMQGPDVELGPVSALSLAMIVHELATNAVKYGALSVPGGRVDLTWDITEFEARPALELGWSEHGGPPVSAPPRRGFGSRLIERGVAGALGRVELEFPPEGVRCRLIATLPATAPAPGGA
jgi:PAS domain S-box-containing protein